MSVWLGGIWLSTSVATPHECAFWKKKPFASRGPTLLYTAFSFDWQGHNFYHYRCNTSSRWSNSARRPDVALVGGVGVSSVVALVSDWNGRHCRSISSSAWLNVDLGKLKHLFVNLGSRNVDRCRVHDSTPLKRSFKDDSNASLSSKASSWMSQAPM